MAAGWRGPADVPLIPEPKAVNTAENAVRSLQVLLGLDGVSEVEVVCSVRHYARVRFFFERLYRRHGYDVSYRYVARPAPSPRLVGSELGSISRMLRDRRRALRLLDPAHAPTSRSEEGGRRPPPGLVWPVHRFPAWVRRLWSVFGWILDAGLALGLTIVVGDHRARHPSRTNRSGPAPAIVLFALLESVPLAVRRRWPIEVFWLVLAGSAGVDLLTGDLIPAGLVVALYTIAAHAERPSALRAVTGAAAVAAFLIVHDRGLQLRRRRGAGAARGRLGGRRQHAHQARLPAGPRGAGRAARARARAERAARRRGGAGPDRPRAARRDRPQRQRDGRAGRGRRATSSTRDPERAREALQRDRGDRARRRWPSCAACWASCARPAERRSYAPQPGLDALDALVEQVRVGRARRSRSCVEGDAATPLPVGVDLSAYRIVQEALTNTLKHAEASRADVDVRYARPELVGRGRRRRPRRRPSAERRRAAG